MDRNALITRLRDERGSALMVAIIMLFVILGLGTALMTTAKGQQEASGNEVNGESAYSMAEAALNAQIYALSVKWPTATNAPTPGSSPDLGYPTSCNAASNGTSYCPSTSDLAAYPSNTQTCPASTPGDAWNPGPVRSSWTTYVRDAGAAGSAQQELFSDATEKTALPYNSSYASPGSNYLWVRAVGTVNCNTVAVVAEVSMQTLAMSFPKLVLNADSFQITNSGNKTIIDTQGVSSTTSQISLRCGGTSYTPPPPTSCAGYNKTSQVSPSSVTSASTYVSPPASSPTLNATQLAEVKTLAQQNGTYYSGCPSSSANLAGSPVYIEGGSGCQVTLGSENSESAPGFLVLVNGSISMGGNDTYYGVIYALNEGNLAPPTAVVSLGGNSTVVGGIDADGAAQLSLGSSGNGLDCGSHKCGDLEYDASAFNSIVGFGGADETPNTFRVLPANQ